MPNEAVIQLPGEGSGKRTRAVSDTIGGTLIYQEVHLLARASDSGTIDPLAAGGTVTIIPSGTINTLEQSGTIAAITGNVNTVETAGTLAAITGNVNTVEQSGTIAVVTAVTDITNVVSVDDNTASLTIDNADITSIKNAVEIIDDWDSSDRANVNIDVPSTVTDIQTTNIGTTAIVIGTAACKSVLLQAGTGNAANLQIGGTANQYVEYAASDYVTYNVNNLNLIAVKAVSGTTSTANISYTN